MRRILLPALLGVLLLGACGTGAGTAGAADVTGTWGDTADPGAPSLDFDPNGRVSGTDGCNLLMGHWSVAGNRVALRDMATTLIGCPPEMDTWLAAAAAAEVDGDTLRVYDEAGTEIGVLER